MNDFQDKVIVVTGGNSGIGYATAKLFKAWGATVVITGRRKDALEKAAKDLGVHAIVADQSQLADVESLVSQVQAGFGTVDVLFINAGVAAVSPIEQTTEALFDQVVDINFKGSFFTLSRFIPLLADGASVIFLSSNTASMTNPSSSVYSASKAALNSIMKTAALELAPRKIRVNAVSPGPTETEILNKMGFDETTLDHIKTSTKSRIPIGRIGSADDVAKMVAYLSGDAAKFVTGAELLMDGGMVLS